MSSIFPSAASFFSSLSARISSSRNLPSPCTSSRQAVTDSFCSIVLSLITSGSAGIYPIACRIFLQTAPFSTPVSSSSRVIVCASSFFPLKLICARLFPVRLFFVSRTRRASPFVLISPCSLSKYVSCSSMNAFSLNPVFKSFSLIKSRSAAGSFTSTSIILILLFAKSGSHILFFLTGKDPSPYGEGLYFRPNHLYTAYWSAINFHLDHLYTTYRSVVIFLYTYTLASTKGKGDNMQKNFKLFVCVITQKFL